MERVKFFGVFFCIFFFVSLGMGAEKPPAERNFRAELSGAEEVPAVKTNAKGQATFQLVKKGEELAYKVTVEGLGDVTAAHIHQGKKGENGPPVVNLFAGPEKKGKISGVLAEGKFTADKMFGPLTGKPLKALIDMMENGEAYVNVHTQSRPEGEIRGQIK
jgi:hypothetical protein